MRGKSHATMVIPVAEATTFPLHPVIPETLLSQRLRTDKVTPLPCADVSN